MKVIRFILIAALWGFALSLSAQKTGISLGLNAYKPSVGLASGDNSHITTGFGVVGGFVAALPLGRKLEIRPSLELSSRKQGYRTTYFDLSVPVVWTSVTEKKGGWLAGAGPTANSSLRFFRLDPGLCGQVGYEIPFGVSLNLRYTINFRDQDPASEATVKDRMAALLINYFF